jgi:hypothetical protein
MLSLIRLSVVMLSPIRLSVGAEFYAESSEFRYAESCYAECHYAECHYASVIMLCDIVLNNALLSIVATPSGAPYGIPQTANVRLGLKQFQMSNTPANLTGT